MTILEDCNTKIDEETLRETPAEELLAESYRCAAIDVNSFPASSCPWHWHSEAEFFFIAKGTLIYHIPDKQCRFEEGDVGFVNGDILHMTKAEGSSPVIQQYHIFLPGLLSCPLNHELEAKYIYPVLHTDSAELLRFPAASPQAALMRHCMEKAYDIYTQKPFGYEILLRNTASELWLALLQNMPKLPAEHKGRDRERVREMVRYIESNYAGRLALEDVVAVAHIGKSEGARCFKRMLNMSIFEYLIAYRIDRAKEALTRSDKSITEIAQSCGFPSSNYFGKVFRKKTGMMPKEYRWKYGKRGMPG